MSEKKDARVSPGEEAENSFPISMAERGRRLDRILSARFNSIGRSAWQGRIRSGEVLVDEKITRAGRKMRGGEIVRFFYNRRPEPEVNRDYRILFEDKDILVIDKPANLPVHPSGIFFRHTLQALLKEARGEAYIAHFAHRLDRETSGVLILAQNPSSASALSRSFRQREVHKEYLVIVEGDFPDRLKAAGFIGRDSKSLIRKKMQYVPGENGDPPVNYKSSRTEFRLLGKTTTESTTSEPDHKLCVLQTRLHTGRLHQIRATLNSLGYPVVGDRLYGIDSEIYLRFIDDLETKEDRDRLIMKRTALHCRRIIIEHPASKKRMSFVSPVPVDMATYVNAAIVRRAAIPTRIS